MSAPTDDTVLANAPKHVADQLLGKSWDDLEVLEHAGHLLFPAEVYRRVRGGEFEPIKVRLRVPRGTDLRKARVKAREWALEEGLDLQADRDLVDDLEIMCTLARAIRNATPPHEPWVADPRELDKDYDRRSLMQVWGKLDSLVHVLDPAPNTISGDEMVALLGAIVRENSIVPLAVYGPESQAGFIVTMAGQLLSLLQSKSSSG